MPLTVRLTAKTERVLNSLARRRRQTRSDVVREAIEHYTSATIDDDTRDRGPYHQWADVIGAVRIGGRNPGKTTGELFTAVVVRKARAGRNAYAARGSITS
jgi:Ribbon-helix-helix protein, copG family